jgi:chromosomal replication initiator protein
MKPTQITDQAGLWDKVLAEMELSISGANFKTWFKDTYINKQEEGTVFLAVPNSFVKTWLLDKFHKTILRSLRNFDENIRAVEYIVTKEDNKKKPEQTGPKQITPTKELPLADFYINKDDNLNPRYTFDTFVVGPFNELAYAASQAIIKKPGVVYNPLLIYGDTGRGKTHLIQAIGNHIKSANKNKKVFYLTSEKFALDYISSVHDPQKINSFKEKYRKYDVLIMDDIQFLAGKEKSQEELFHLFNNLYDNNKQIIFSSDKHPNYIQNLENRLRSRFAAGMIVDISAPDQESRAAIVRAKTILHNLNLSPEIIDYIATSVDSNIRELEGALNIIVCQAELKGKDLNIADIKNILKSSSKPKKAVSVVDVVKIVAGFYNIEEDSLCKKTRHKEVVKPRQLAMYILREDFNISYPTIGQKMGGRDHTTVIHSYEKIKEELKINSVLAEELSQIRSMI